MVVAGFELGWSDGQAGSVTIEEAASGCRGADNNFFTFGLDGGGGVKVLLYPPKWHHFDVRSTKITSI